MTKHIRFFSIITKRQTGVNNESQYTSERNNYIRETERTRKVHLIVSANISAFTRQSSIATAVNQSSLLHLYTHTHTQSTLLLLISESAALRCIRVRTSKQYEKKKRGTLFWSDIMSRREKFNSLKLSLVNTSTFWTHVRDCFPIH